jgi:ElaB/YqjD/DUF883 family membrane-anchored ribosome-binding protein
METHFPHFGSSQSRRARERLLNDLKTVARDAEDLIKATAGDAGEKAKEAGSRLTETVERAKATCQDLQERSVASAKAAVDEVDETVRTHPYQSMGVALGIGVLLGALLRKD